MIRITPRHASTTGLDMTPLMDVIFILLLFFVLAASFTIHGLDIDLPQAKATKAISGRIVEIRLSTDGKYTIDDVPVARDDLPYKIHDLVKTFRSHPGQMVLLASPQAPVESLIFLVDHVRRNGGEKLMVATAPEGQKK